MSDLFASAPAVPLAEALRPASIDEVIGQRHLLGPGKPLRLAFEARKPHSLDSLGAAGRRQDDDRAPDGRCFRR